jgi:hypothetical protein
LCVPFPRSRAEYIEPRRLNQDRYLGGLCLSSLPCRVGHAVPTALYRSVVPCKGYCWISQAELGCAGSCRAMFWGTDRSTPHLWRKLRHGVEIPPSWPDVAPAWFCNPSSNWSRPLSSLQQVDGPTGKLSSMPEEENQPAWLAV